VEAVVRMNQHTAARKNITIKAVLPGNLPQIEMDGSRIEEVLDNLVGNAVKYSRPDSTVRVEIKGTPSHLTIEVTDSGFGLSQRDLDEAFMFGKKLSTVPTGGEDSSGVGLWVVRKIVEAHHGVVWVRSTPGKGSTFSVMLPTTQR
jgi:signal transduction histidine kinase